MSTNQPSMHRRTLFRAGVAAEAGTVGRRLDNRNRTPAYPRFVDADRQLHAQ